ncbi:MAG TPA: hypothetical protein DIW64_11650 [Cellvibrio sp.]|nr:hypothetical protein [Cellvibrio sp.]
MNRKNRKGATRNNWLKNLLSGLIRLTIVITIFLSGNDYHITTVIQLNASHHEASNLRVVVEQQSTRLQTADIWRPGITSPLSRITQMPVFKHSFCNNRYRCGLSVVVPCVFIGGIV